jgi:hypothetical protein
MSQQKVLGKTAWNTTSGGRCKYLYSGKFGSGAEAAVSVTLVDMDDSGLDDLYVKLFYTFDADNIPTSNYIGYSVNINDEEVFFTKTEANANVNIPTTMQYEFILPRSSKLVILGICEAIMVDRAAALIAHPLKVVYA